MMIPYHNDFNLNGLAGSMSDLERRRRNRATSGLNRNISRPSRGRVLTSMSSSSNLSERLDRAQSASNMTSSQGSSEAMMETTGSRPPIWSRSHTRSPKPGSNNSMVADTGRTIEQVLPKYIYGGKLQSFLKLHLLQFCPQFLGARLPNRVGRRFDKRFWTSSIKISG